MRSRFPFTARLLLALCLLASGVQGHVAQTHVHAVRAVERDAISAPAPAELTCLLCEIAGHTPAAAPPTAGAPTALLEFARPPVQSCTAPAATASVCHHWLSRGPPPV